MAPLPLLNAMNLNGRHSFFPCSRARLLRTVQLTLFVLFAFFAIGCAGHQTILSPLDDALDDKSTEEAAEKLLQSDSQGPLPAPSIPPELAGKTAAKSALSLQTSDTPVQYTVRSESPDDPSLAKSFLSINTLTKMQDNPIYSVTSLEQRLEASLKEGRDILHANGYYTGRVQGALKFLENSNAPAKADGNTEAKDTAPPLRAEVTVTFYPGPQYTLGKTSISYTNQEQVDAGSAPALPRTLEDVGLPPQSPALADKVLDAVSRVQKTFRNSGYPEAQIASSQYFLNHGNQTLDVEIHVLPGPFMRMGEIALPKGASVDENYLFAKRTWKVGEPWNQDKIEAFRDALRQTGLFVSIDIAPGKEGEAPAKAEASADTEKTSAATENSLSATRKFAPNAGAMSSNKKESAFSKHEKDPPKHEKTSGTSDKAPETRPIEVVLIPAPERTVGGSLKYDTSFGPGVQAFWEHRNLTGHGDSLRFEAPVWMDMQEFTAKYRLPFFVRDDQDFIAQFAILNEDLDAYNLQAVRLAMGVDRRLSRHWKATVQGSAESGSLKDPKKPREEYLMFGLPFTLAFDSTNSILDATKGGRATLNLAPYTGEYRDDFTVLRSRLDLQRFIPLVGDDTLVLALRGTAGAMSGADAGKVPPSVRFYSGGGGSVRGYEYQSLGPRNYRDDPLGGSALTEVSIEPRWRFSETFGVVAFVDGGMAYKDVDEFGQDLRWGAGLGLRVYTPIGPVRVDVATPLNPRSDDDPVQFYLSIGQSF